MVIHVGDSLLKHFPEKYCEQYFREFLPGHSMLLGKFPMLVRPYHSLMFQIS